MVLSKSIDGFTAGSPLAALTDGRDAMIAIGMNGEVLPQEHGFPARIVVPGPLRVRVGDQVGRRPGGHPVRPGRGLLDAARLVADGPDQDRVADRRAHDGARVSRPARWRWPGSPGPCTGGSSKVEVRVDNGDWVTGRLADEPSIDTWRQWVYEWAATPGKHRLQVRATDGNDDLQIQFQAPPPPDGATGWHTIDVTVS